MNQNEIFKLLRPHQSRPVQDLLAILSRHQSAVDLSDTGTGKTYVASAVASLLGAPTLVVAPKIARCAWERAAAHFGDSFSFANYELLRAGNTPFGHWDNPDPKPVVYYQCQSCQQKVDLSGCAPCYAHPGGIHCIETKKKPARYGKFNFHPAVQQVIFDEVHRCGGLDSLNADILIAAKRQRLKILGLSATAACNPLNMRALGYAMDLHNLDHDVIGVTPSTGRMLRPSFTRWARGHGCVRDARFHGWKWLVGAERQRETMLGIRSQLIPERGVRVSWKDIPGFPERTITAELVDLDSPEAIDGCYTEMAAAVEALKLRSGRDKAPELALTKILRGREQVELLKVPAFTEMAQDYLAKGMSVVFFVNFRSTIDELFKRFPDSRIIDGKTPNRDDVVNQFQENSISSIIVNCDAGGISLSLQDLDGFHPRVGLVSPGFSAVVLRQVFGRLHRDGGLSPCFYRVIFANKTVEMQVHRAVGPKCDNIDALNDADLTPENLLFK